MTISTSATDRLRHDADWPSDIPRLGWLDIARRVGRSMARDEVWLRAAGVAFCALFAAIPGAAVPVSLYGLVATPEGVHYPVEMLRGLLPGAASEFLADQMQAIATSRMTLGAGLGGVLLAALWGVWGGASALITAVNLAYGKCEGRRFFHRQLVVLVVAVAACLFGMMAFALVAVLPVVLGTLPLNTGPQTALSLARWPALAFLMIGTLGLLYRFAPCRPAAKWRWVSPGAAVATTVWLAGSAGLSHYVYEAPTYQETFGALGMVMLLLTWFYLTAFSVLLGAEANAELERQTTRDTRAEPARL